MLDLFPSLQVGLLASYVLLFGNEMLLTSFFFSSLVTIFVSIHPIITHGVVISLLCCTYWKYTIYVDNLVYFQIIVSLEPLLNKLNFRVAIWVRTESKYKKYLYIYYLFYCMSYILKDNLYLIFFFALAFLVKRCLI